LEVLFLLCKSSKENKVNLKIIIKNKMSKISIQIPQAPLPIGPYSPAILKNGTLYISGQVPLNPTTGKLINDDIKAATQQVMENLEALLNAADMGFDDVVKCSIFMKDLGDFQEMNAIYGTYFKNIPPARETIEIARLPLDAIIEISCIAIK